MTKYSKLSNEKLQALIEEKELYIDKLFDEATLPWKDYVKEVENTNIWEMYVEKRNRQTPKMRNAINRIPFNIKRVPIFIWNMIVLAIVTIIFYLCKI